METKTISLILRISLAFAFLYPALAGLLTPLNWIGYFPPFLLDLVPALPLLISFEIFEIIIGLWILSGWRIIYPSSIAILMLLLIIIFNWSQIDILFRDISIAISALGLILLEDKR